MAAAGGNDIHGDELKDELKKLGLRLRPRRVGGAGAEKPGKISLDDRSNAQFARGGEHLDEDGDTGAASQHPNLSVMDDHPAADAPIRNNPKGLRVGYDPYESGLLAKKAWKPKRNLREFSKWIETRKKLNDLPPEED